MAEAKNMESSRWWWLDSHSKANSNRSPWLQTTLAELDEKTKKILKLVEEDADSFAQRAEMYYRKRPEIITMVEDFYRTHRSLAERFDQIQSDSPARLITSPWSPSPLPPFTRYRLEKSPSLTEKSYDSYSDAYGPDGSEVSDVDDPEPEQEGGGEENGTGQENLIGFEGYGDEVMSLRKKVEVLEDEHKVMKLELMEKDEEKREVIRQLTRAMEVLREENAELRWLCVASLEKKSAPKKGNRVDFGFNRFKEGFLGNLFGGSGKSSIPI